MYTCAMRHP